MRALAILLLLFPALAWAQPSSEIHCVAPATTIDDDPREAIHEWTHYAACAAQGMNPQSQRVAQNLQKVDATWESRRQRIEKNYRNLWVKIWKDAQNPGGRIGCKRWKEGRPPSCAEWWPSPTREAIQYTLFNEHGYAWHLQRAIDHVDTFLHLSQIDASAHHARNYVYDNLEEFELAHSPFLASSLKKHGHKFNRAYHAHRRMLCEGNALFPEDTPVWLGPDCTGESGIARHRSQDMVALARDARQNTTYAMNQVNLFIQALHAEEPNAIVPRQCLIQAIQDCLDGVQHTGECHSPCH